MPKDPKSSEMFRALFPRVLRNAVPLSKGKDCKLSNNKANQSQKNRKEKTISIKSINSEVLSILHLNIRRLRKKTDELISSLHPNFRHMLCITEHHMNQQELEHIHIENYDLGASYCRREIKKRGVSTFVHRNLKSTNINLEDYCKEQVIEAGALKLESSFLNFYILTLYRSPSRNFDQSLSRPETILNALHTQKIKIVPCANINITYLIDSNRKQALDPVLLSYNLFSTVNFPKRIQKNYCSAIDNIFVENSKVGDYSVSQLLEIKDIELQAGNIQYQTLRKIYNDTMAEFVAKLSFQSWDTVFDSSNTDSKFNCSLNTYFRIFYSRFPLIRVKNGTKNKTWITAGITTSCKHKKELYLASRNSTDSRLKNYYKRYCNIVSKVIKKSKRYYYSSQINNKTKTI